ncbi:BTAD domain-containing putative transcriptional regulator [Catellatospora sichuanensis]|uniref:BTAD domain-containing putative transcriptional regulator n=1 Tax=Catellatospora sichuanensis TaxID=1969805 RepID=UPI001183253E|nr:BTAD domain-containing putative transcriptional regulator [Catellatospora sichuanensis]
MSAPTPTTSRPRGSFAGRAMRGLISACGLLVMLAGLPAALVVLVGWPLPDAWPTGEQWMAWLAQPVTVPFVVGLFACAGWLLWAGLLAAVAAEVLSVVARVDTSSWRLPAPLRAVAAGLVGAVVITVVGSAARAANKPAPTHVVAAPDAAAYAAVGARDVVEAVPPVSAATTTEVHHGTITFTVRGERYHAIVRRGDTMSKIARQWLGDADRWPEICRLNWHRHWPKTGGKLRDCDVIYPRWDLRLPADATPPTGAVRVGVPAPGAPPQRPTPEPAPPKPTFPAPTDADPDGVVEPDATTVAPSTADNHGDTSPGSSPQTLPSAGITLPGGWVSTAMAASILAAIAGGWAMRHHRYRPRKPSGLQDTDPWWPPLPDIVGRLRQALRRNSQPDIDDPDGDQGCLAQTVTTAGSGPTEHPSLPPANRSVNGDAYAHADADAPTEDANTVVEPLQTATGPELAGIGTLPPGGLVLAGPGAHAAARGLIAATLTLPNPNPDNLITTIATTGALLGDGDLHHPRLTVAATTADAIEHITRQILSRTRQAQDNDQPPPSATVLLLDTTDGHDKVLDALLPVAAGSNIGAVLLNTHPGAVTITVDTDGHTDHGTRITTLDTTSTLDLLHHTNPPATTTPPPSSQLTVIEPEPAAAPTTPGTTKTQVKIIGRPQILDHHGQPITGLRTKATQTLVLLAVQRTHVAKADLWEMLFPDATMQRAEERFAVTIADLRNGFRRASGDKTRNAVPNPGGRYRLAPDLVEVDLWQFSDHLTASAQATDPELRQQHLRRALALHTGPLAEGTDYDWIEPHQHTYTSKVIDILVTLAQNTEDPRQAAELLDQACALSPANTEIFRQTLKAWNQAGLQSRAHNAIKRYRSALQELEINIDHETARLIHVADMHHAQGT